MKILQYIKILKSAKNSLKKQRLYALLFTLTLWLVLFASAVPTYSQTSKSTTQQSCEAQIEKRAKQDAENDEITTPKTELAIKLYQQECPNLKPSRIAEIYDTAFQERREAKKKDLRELLKPENGWVGLLILLIGTALGTAFGNTLINLFSSIFNTVGNQIYGRFSGFQLMRHIALKQYKEELKEKYEKLKISFRPNRPLNLKDIYVPLKVTGTNDNNLIDAFQAVAKYHRIMVKGSPGSGKTMLLKYIALCYAEGGWVDFFKKFQCVPILVELYRFSNKELTVEQQLVEALKRDGFPKAESFVSQSLDKNKLLLLLDGLDEVSSNERQKVVDLINDFLDTHQNCPVIITCRTAVYRNEFNNFIEQTLEVVEFNDQQIREFLVPWKPDMPAGKSVEQLMQTLHDRPRIMALARNPLMLTIIAYLYADTDFVLPHSRAEFYRKATDILLEQWHQERNLFQAREKKLILQHLALFFQDNANQQGQDRRSVDWRTVESEVINILPDLNLQPDCTRAILFEIVERNGLLLAIDGGERYQFAHLTLQEFFAASQLREDANGLVSRFKADPDAWRETLKLWCGIASDSTNLITEVCRVNSVVAFECLADVQKVDSVLANEIINTFKSELGVDGNEDIVNHAFASVAADDRRRTDVFTFLKETLNNTSETDSRRKGAANALSLTNLLSAAEVLTKQYINIEKIEFRQILDQALIRMGDIAVPEIEKAVTNESINQVMDALVSIGTPSALQALVNCLWNQNENVALRAALLLASVLQLEKHEKILGNCQLPQRYSRQRSFDWIWRPFEEPAYSKLTIIAGQIAYLLSKNLELSISDETINYLSVHQLDYRIVVPLCVIQAENQIKSVFSQRMQDKPLPKIEVQSFKINQNNYKQWLLELLEDNAFTLWGFILFNLSPFVCFFLYYNRGYLLNNLQKEWVNRAWSLSLKKIIADYPYIKKSKLSKIIKEKKKSFLVTKILLITEKIRNIIPSKNDIITHMTEKIVEKIIENLGKTNNLLIDDNISFRKIKTILFFWRIVQILIFPSTLAFLFSFSTVLLYLLTNVNLKASNYFLIFSLLLLLVYLLFGVVMSIISELELQIGGLGTYILLLMSVIGEKGEEWGWEVWEEKGMKLDDLKKLGKQHKI
nr:NACHT domain-containing protein [Nostoc sp. ChiQUE02]MDZ8234006.1 NACHT domain-containing protein [Nostoc sp. ChiQUE02]